MIIDQYPPPLPPTVIIDGKEYGLGRLPAKDSRDRPLKLLLAQPLASGKDGSRWYMTGPVLDQGSTSSCVGHAWRQWLSSALLMTKTGPSPFDIYNEAQKADEWPGEDYDGTSVRGGAKFLQLKGHVKAYFWATSAAEVKQFILSRLGGVVFGTNWYESMFTATKGYLKIGGSLAGGHAYLCIGYSKPRNAFRFINSWSKAFADKGRFWLSFADVQRLISEDGEACCATEVKVPHIV